MQLGWKLENCYKPSTPNTPQQAQAGDEDKCLDRNDIAPAPVSESPKRLSPAKISPNVNEVNMTNDRPDGAVEHRARHDQLGIDFDVLDYRRSGYVMIRHKICFWHKISIY